MDGPYETNGEHLRSFLRKHHLGGESVDWNHVSMALLATNRGAEWTEAIREMALLHLSQRLITAGKTIASHHGGVGDVLVEKETKQAIVDSMVIHYSLVGELYTRLLPAVRSALQTISPGVRHAVEGFTRRVMPYCYLCGTDGEVGGDGPSGLTLDHVWPRAYGGDSEEENLLPACGSCNERKGSTPSWALYPIQALVAGFDLTDDDLAALPKEARFAVHARAAAQHAERYGVCLRDAYIALGRPTPLQVVDASASVDIFNLTFVTS